ncbi:MAG TPA: hypothetical protein VIF15_00060 [Polyangiaceae bacterium]|jgi:hypothetical protein
MKARFALLAAPCFILAATSFSPARAQTPPPPQGNQPSATDARALAETLFFTARGLMEAGRYAEACGKLSESYRLDPASGTLLNLAVCNQKIGKIASAWGEFRDAQAEARRMNRPDREQLATQNIAAIEPELPFLAIKVPAAVRSIPGLEITRNGVPLQSGAWDTELPVDPGQVEIVERAPLYKPKTLHVTVANKEHASLEAAPLELAPVERPPEPFWTGRRTWGVVLVGAGVLAAGAGTFFGLDSINSRKNSDSSCPTMDGERRCTQQGVDDMNKARTSAWISDIGFGVAVVGVGLGTYFLFTGGSSHEQAAAPTIGSSGWSWLVGAGPTGATGTLTHSF